MTRLRVGDMVAIPVDATRWALAYVLAIYKSSAYYLEVHEATLDELSGVDLDAALGSACVFAALTFDARVHAGDWRVVGHRAVDPELRLAPYLLGRDDRMRVEDFTGKRSRAAGPADVRLLRHRKVVSPILLEQAVQAHFGMRPWAPHYDAYRCPSPAVLALAIFDDG